MEDVGGAGGGGEMSGKPIQHCMGGWGFFVCLHTSVHH